MTNTYKHAYNGWTSEDIFNLNHQTEEGAMQLRLSTSKCGGGRLSTHASVTYGKSDGSYSCTISQDFSKTVLVAKARATAKTVEAQQVEALKGLPDIMKAVNADYSLNLEAAA